MKTVCRNTHAKISLFYFLIIGGGWLKAGKFEKMIIKHYRKRNRNKKCGFYEKIQMKVLPFKC